MSPKLRITESYQNLNCPGCDGANIRASRRSGVVVTVLAIVGYMQLRCQNCGRRFFRLRGRVLTTSGRSDGRSEPLRSQRTLPGTELQVSK